MLLIFCHSVFCQIADRTKDERTKTVPIIRWPYCLFITAYSPDRRFGANEEVVVDDGHGCEGAIA